MRVQLASSLDPTDKDAAVETEAIRILDDEGRFLFEITASGRSIDIHAHGPLTVCPVASNRLEVTV